MSKPWRILRDKLPPEVRERAEARTRELLAECSRAAWQRRAVFALAALTLVLAVMGFAWSNARTMACMTLGVLAGVGLRRLTEDPWRRP
jgi:hypothetical protein